jgi:hypothetical protein
VFHVIARDGSGNTSTEATAAFSVARPPLPPPIPYPATATRIASRVVRVTWANVPNETSYVVDRCPGGPLGGPCTANAVILPGDVTTFDDTVSASPGTQLFYRVKACNGNGCSSSATTGIVILP